MTPQRWTTEDFDTMSWHDNAIYGVAFDVADGASDLVLDIDYILEWIVGPLRRASFLVAPATLRFAGVTDAHVEIAGMSSEFQVALFAPTISHIRRTRVNDQRVYLDRPYWEWTIELAAPGARLSFGAVGFTQELRRAPVVCSEQRYPHTR